MAGDSISDAIDVINFINANGCDRNNSLAPLLTNFQLSYNDDVQSGIYPGPKLEVDGLYGNNTASALNVVIGPNSGTPAGLPIPSYPACKRAVAPPPFIPPTPSVPSPPAPTPPGPPAVVPVIFHPVTPAQNSGFNLTSWLIGAAVVATVVGAGMYYNHEKRKQGMVR